MKGILHVTSLSLSAPHPTPTKSQPAQPQSCHKNLLTEMKIYALFLLLALYRMTITSCLKGFLLVPKYGKNVLQ